MNKKVARNQWMLINCLKQIPASELASTLRLMAEECGTRLSNVPHDGPEASVWCVAVHGLSDVAVKVAEWWQESIDNPA